MSDEKKQIISDMILMAQADKVIHEREYHFILAIAASFGIEKHAVDELVDTPFQKTVFSSDVERITQFQRVLLLMNVDRDTQFVEVDALRNYALRLGIRPEAVEQILGEMNDHENKMIPAERLMEIFKRFYN